MFKPNKLSVEKPLASKVFTNEIGIDTSNVYMVLAQTPFSVLARTLFWYSLGLFFDTHSDSTPFPVLAQTLLRY